MKAKVTLTPLCNKIKWRINGRVVCGSKVTITNSLTLPINDSTWDKIFSSSKEKIAF